MLEVTASAIEEIRRLQISRNQVDHYCRLEIKQGGCAGRYYSIGLTSEQQADDIQYNHSGISFLLASRDQAQLEALKLDYIEDLMGGTFRFQNSLATETCRCGLSFA